MLETLKHTTPDLALLSDQSIASVTLSDGEEIRLGLFFSFNIHFAMLLNFKVPIAGRVSGFIVCRHMAWLALVLAHVEFKKNQDMREHSPASSIRPIKSFDYLQHMDTEEKISALQETALNFDRLKIISSADHVYLFDKKLSDLGEVLELACSDMILNEFRTFVLLSDNHAMSIVVNRLQNEREENYFSVQFFDPNDMGSITVKVVDQHEQGNLAGLMLYDFLRKPSIRRYWPKGNYSASLCYYSSAEDMPFARTTGSTIVSGASTIYLNAAMTIGLEEMVRSILTEIAVSLATLGEKKPEDSPQNYLIRQVNKLQNTSTALYKDTRPWLSVASVTSALTPTSRVL
ncbi:MAG: ShET2/EspL2 family type III secretion system effector toxin [Gammaproteobacteria bacterium]|nr:ShET2/EspL2 family type III secretion system effector toxin [Gammaproteobacteria bacterium]